MILRDLGSSFNQLKEEKMKRGRLRNTTSIETRGCGGCWRLPNWRTAEAEANRQIYALFSVFWLSKQLY